MVWLFGVGLGDKSIDLPSHLLVFTSNHHRTTQPKKGRPHHPRARLAPALHPRPSRPVPSRGTAFVADLQLAGVPEGAPAGGGRAVWVRVKNGWVEGAGAGGLTFFSNYDFVCMYINEGACVSLRSLCPYICMYVCLNTCPSLEQARRPVNLDRATPYQRDTRSACSLVLLPVSPFLGGEDRVVLIILRHSFGVPLVLSVSVSW